MRKILSTIVISGLLFLLVFILIKPKIIEGNTLGENIEENQSFLQSSLELSEEKFLPFLPEEFKENLLIEKSDFMEIDLEEMKTKIYQKGEEISEFSILTRGDPTSWAGEPIGLYRAGAKFKVAFSNSSEVYMPYAVHIWGKYYLHGQPYYPDGRLYQTRFSGGCIRFSDQDAKKLFDFVKEGTPILITDSGFKSDNFQYSLVNEKSEFPEISAKSYLIADLNNGFIFSEKNSQEILPIASLTKLMTALVVQERVDLRKSILITQKMIKPFKSLDWFRPKLKVGNRYKVVELFYPSLISSSNDAAEALSYFRGKEATIKLMNEKAQSIGMKDTKFSEPTGLGAVIKAEENLSTTRNLFYLAQYILNVRPLIFKITKGEKVQSFGPVSFKDLNNKNIFFEEPNFIGGRTGYTEAAGYTGIFLFNFPIEENLNRKIAIILLNAEKLKKDAQDILEWLNKSYFNNLSLVE